jgi:site-specific DNA-methyltransferase (adenine-specific)
MKTPVSIVTQEDCMDLMSRYPDKYFELAIVDPPYGIGEDGKSNHSRGGKTKFGGKHAKHGSYIPPKMYAAKGWDKEPPSQNYFNELKRVSKNQIIWGANHFISRIPYDSSCWIVWDKRNGENDFADCELAWSSFKTAVRKYDYKWHGMLQENMKNKEERVHPTQKPVALYKWLLSNYAKEGDKILDTHLGSGSSRIAAYIMGFDFYGCEIDQDYFNAQEKRFKEQTAQQSLFNYEKTA